MCTNVIPIVSQQTINKYGQAYYFLFYSLLAESECPAIDLQQPTIPANSEKNLVNKAYILK